MYLLDTDVVSEARKPHCDANVRRWLAAVRASDLFLSVLVVGEIRHGIERLRSRDPAQSAVYEAWLETLLRDYSDRILPIDSVIAQEWGRMNVPDQISVLDGLMAATAKVRGFAFVTRNIQDLTRSGARLLNPFAPAPDSE